MSRVGALAALTALGLSTPGAVAQEPPGRSSAAVVIPKGALPPGPAIAQELPSGETARVAGAEWPLQRIRFQMPDAPMTVEFSRSLFEMHKGFDVEARSDRGPTWRGSIDATASPTERLFKPNTKLFVGTADQLAKLSQVAHSVLPDEAEELVNGFELRAAEEDIDLLCRSLPLPATLVFAEASPEMAAALRRCAARGAAIVAIGPKGLAATDLDPGRGTLWGAGRYGWSPNLDHLASDALRDILHDRSGGSALRLLAADPGAAVNRELLSVDSQGILWLLAAYVLALALVGAWGVSRPRRSTLLWIAFPATAALAAGSLAFVAITIDHEPAQLQADFLDVVGPSGDGVEAISLKIHARGADTFEISMPWGDGKLENFRLERGLSGPFAAAGGRASMLEDQLAGSLTLSDLQIARRSNASLQLALRISRVAPYLEGSAGDFAVVNPTSRTLEQVVLVLDGKRATAAAVPPGGRKALRLGDTPDDAFPTWLIKVDSWSPEERLPPHTYLLASKMEPETLTTVRPAIENRGGRAVVTIGPVGPHAVAQPSGAKVSP